MDADWAGNGSDRRSTSGFMFSFGSGAVSWSSKNNQQLHYQARKQNTEV
jgi:hypothetical protein